LRWRHVPPILNGTGDDTSQETGSFIVTAVRTSDLKEIEYLKKNFYKQTIHLDRKHYFHPFLSSEKIKICL
jgi:hypothetical protein